MFYLLSAVIGVFIIIATILNGKIAYDIGMAEGMKINYFVGAGFSLAIMIIAGEVMMLEAVIDKSMIIYILSGTAGAASLYILNRCVVEIPAFYIVILPFIGQLLTGIFIDYAAFDMFSLKKLIGGIIIIIGLIVYNGIKELKTN